MPCTPLAFAITLSPSATYPKKEPALAQKTKELKKEIKHRKAKIEGHLAKMAKALKALKKKS